MKPRFPYLKVAATSHGLLSLIAILVCCTLAIAQTPVAHWTFDDGLNNYDLTTVVDIVNGNNGVWQDLDSEENFDTSGLSYAPGIIGGAVRLAGGDNQYFLVDSIPQINGILPTPPFGGGDPVLGVGVTWSAWMYVAASAPSVYKGILASRTVSDDTETGPGTNQNWGLNWEGGDHIDARLSTNPLDSSANSITRDQWHHVVMVWGNVDGTAAFIPPAFRVYVDGVLESEDPDSGVFELIDSGSWLIGEDTASPGREFQGLLDDLAIFGSALSTAQVQSLYNNGLNGINASGINTAAIMTGDVDGSGVVDPADFGIILDNLGKSVAARNLGDLDGNRRVDLNDYQQWLESVPPSMAAAAFQAYFGVVPEPSCLVLAALVAAASCGVRSCRPPFPQ